MQNNPVYLCVSISILYVCLRNTHFYVIYWFVVSENLSRNFSTSTLNLLASLSLNSCSSLLHGSSYMVVAPSLYHCFCMSASPPWCLYLRLLFPYTDANLPSADLMEALASMRIHEEIIFSIINFYYKQ